MPRPDWDQQYNGGISFGRKSRIVTPGNTDIDPFAKSVVMLTAGDITIVPYGNDNGITIAFAGLPAGYIIPFQIRRVTACTGTCATID